MSTALITGASRGFGLALAEQLADRGWRLVLDARGADALADAADRLATRTRVHAIPGDVADPAHRRALADAVDTAGGLDLLVNNASTLGPSPRPALVDLEEHDLLALLHVNAFDPGDMRTAMHQEAFPDEDISDRPEPSTAVPALLHLLDHRPPSGRVRAAEVPVEEEAA